MPTNNEVPPLSSKKLNDAVEAAQSDEIQGKTSAMARIAQALKEIFQSRQKTQDPTVIRGKGRRGRTGPKNPPSQESNNQD